MKKKERSFERFVFLPLGCGSDASVGVGKCVPKKPKPEHFKGNKTKWQERSVHVKRKKSTVFLAVPKPNHAPGNGLINKIKTFSHHLFDVSDEESETELEIGLPTDVIHVSHIGLDGSTITNPTFSFTQLDPTLAQQICAAHQMDALE